MKNKWLNLMMGSVLLASTTTEAALHYRFWKGFKKPELTTEQFIRSLNTVFVGETVRVGAGKGLVAYMPVVPKVMASKAKDIKLADELALVVYKSEEHYKNIRSTPDGIAYGNLHWEYFDKEAGSKSAVAEPFNGSFEAGKSYELFQSDLEWQNGFPVFNAFKVNNQAQVIDYIDAVKKFLASRGLENSIIMVDGSIVYEVQLWTSKDVYNENLQLIWSTQFLIDSILENQKTVQGLPNTPKLDSGVMLQNNFKSEIE